MPSMTMQGRSIKYVFTLWLKGNPDMLDAAKAVTRKGLEFLGVTGGTDTITVVKARGCVLKVASWFGEETQAPFSFGSLLMYRSES